jgi:hypothetical protein
MLAAGLRSHADVRLDVFLALFERRRGNDQMIERRPPLTAGWVHWRRSQAPPSHRSTVKEDRQVPRLLVGDGVRDAA